MKVQLKLFAYFEKYRPERDEQGLFTLDLVPPISVGDVLQKLGVPAQYPRVIHINGKFAAEETLLKDGDLIAVFPPLPGG